MTKYFQRPLSLLTATLFLLSSSACFAKNDEKVQASKKNFSQTSLNVMALLNQMHYKKQPFDNVLSNNLLTAFLAPQKLCFIFVMGTPTIAR